MSQQVVSFKTVEMINGRDAKSYSIEDLIVLIESTKRKIDALNDANEGIESKTIGALLSKQQAALDGLVAELDKREVK